MSKVDNLLTILKDAIRNGELTKAPRIDSETFICLTEQTSEGLNYHQVAFDTLESTMQSELRFQVVGAKIGGLKIVAIFDMWPESSDYNRNQIKAPLAC